MKILLINPPANIIESRAEIKMCSQPLGLMYIAATLEKHGYEIDIFDTLLNEGYTHETQVRPGVIRYGLSQEKITEKVRSFSPDVVAISGLHSNRIYEVRETTEAVKRVSPDITTVVGGGLSSLNPMESLEDSNCDYIVRGEGEISFLELIRALQGNKDVSDIEGIGFRNLEKIHINPVRKPISDIDSLPWPAYHLIDMGAYFSIDMPGSRYGKKRYSLFCGSRGCPFSCHYCAKSLLIGEGYRARSIDDMVREIEFLKVEYDIEEIRFVDYHAMANLPRWRYFCQKLIDKKLDIEFSDPHGMAVQSLKDDIIELMWRAGCRKLYISIESSNQAYLDSLRKGVDLQRVEKIINKAKSIGYHITGYFILGLIGQNWDDITRTVDYAKTLDLDDVDFFIANPFPGSGLFEECQEKNLFTDSYHPSRLKYGLSNIQSAEYTAEQLEAFRVKAWMDFMITRKKARKKKKSPTAG